MAKVVFAVVIVLGLYGLFVSFAHMPFFATFLLLPLFLCGVMMMFMGHGKRGTKKH